MASSSAACFYLKPQSAESQRHETKCKTQVHLFVRGMLAAFIWQASQKASWMLWEEEKEATGLNWEVQDLSRQLCQDPPHAAPRVEARLYELTDFQQGPSKLPLRDAIAWMVIEQFEKVDISELTSAQKQTSLDAVARHVAPGLCAHQTRRSSLYHAVHKNIKQLMLLSQHLCSSFDVPSASRMGAAKKRRKGKKMQKAEGCGIQFPEDSDSDDSTCMLAEACDSEKPWEEDIQDEFLMWSGSIADAACIMPEYWVLCD